jgi:hypothetical protein
MIVLNNFLSNSMEQILPEKIRDPHLVNKLQYPQVPAYFSYPEAVESSP